MDGKKVLIVDDEREFLMVLGEMIRSQGFLVVVADNGKDAITIARDERPDLIIMDIVMPDMDGRVVARKLREFDETRGIPVIYLTGSISGEEEAKEDRFVKGDMVFAKPCKLEDLVPAMNRLLEEKEDGLS